MLQDLLVIRYPGSCVGFGADSCKALESWCFCTQLLRSVVGATGRGGDGDEPGNGAELSSSPLTAPEQLLPGMSAAWCRHCPGVGAAQ